MQSTDDTIKSDGNFDEAAIFSDMDSLGDLYTQSTSNDALNARSKFLPKAKSRNLSKIPDVVQGNFSSSNTSSLISSTSLVSETNPAVSSNPPFGSNDSSIKAEAPTSASNMEFMDNSLKHSSPVDSSFLTVQDPENEFSESESLLPENNVDSTSDHGILDGEEAVDLSSFSSLDNTFPEPLSNLGSSGKFHPKLSSRRKDQQLESIPSSGSFHPDTELPERQNQTSGFRLHVDSSASSTRVKGFSTQPKHTEKMDFRTESLVQGVCERIVSETAEAAPRKSSRLRKNIKCNMYANDGDEEDGSKGQSGNLSPSIDAENRTNSCSDSEYMQETSRREKTSKNTKIPSDGTEKSTRKHKQNNDTSGSGEQAPVKNKFLHSTRRTRRRVDKKLLETPEEEIDVKKLRLKDLILLTEARERMSAKEGATEPPQENRSRHPHDLNYGYDEENDYEGYRDMNNEDMIPEASTKYNYHTHMKRSHSQWTKMETEMFYQAIRQFGTDFSMIQQLFPGRTRRQVILKFKNEERKHPLQIADAITHRSKDYTHFEEVIQRLQAQAEEKVRKEHEIDGEESESKDAAGAPEGSEMKKSDGEEQDTNEMDGYNPAKYDDYHESFDWDEIGNEHGDFPYMGKDSFDDSYF